MSTSETNRVCALLYSNHYSIYRESSKSSRRVVGTMSQRMRRMNPKKMTIPKMRRVLRKRPRKSHPKMA